MLRLGCLVSLMGTPGGSGGWFDGLADQNYYLALVTKAKKENEILEDPDNPMDFLEKYRKL